MLAQRTHTKRNLSARVAEARAAARFAKIVQTTKERLAREVEVPGHEAKSYSVIIRRMEATIEVECRVSTSVGAVPCNGHNFVCYHGIASVIAAANSKGRTISVCDNQADAERLAKLGGKVFSIINKRQTDQVWGVVR